MEITDNGKMVYSRCTYEIYSENISDHTSELIEKTETLKLISVDPKFIRDQGLNIQF